MNSIVDWERNTSQWSAVLSAAPGCDPGDLVVNNTLWPIYGPLVRVARDHLFVIGQIGQSLDGRIATPSGHSHYINGEAALVHLHRLRALVDAVVVGVGTVIADDPQLTVRRVERRAGASQPARVVLDPNGRMPARAKCMVDDGARRIVVRTVRSKGAEDPDDAVDYIHVPQSKDGMAARDILAALRQRGLTRILVEGGATTLSRFLAAGCLNRLHVMTAPMIIGSGPMGLTLGDIDRLDQALRPDVATFTLPGGDVLFDCAF